MPIAPYGSWKSPITSDLIVKGTIGLSQPRIAGEDVYWIEMRPSERGRQVIVRRAADGKTTDINPPDFNARTRVHEYGGGDYVVHDGAIYFSNYADQQLYRQKGDSSPERITNECSDDRLRYMVVEPAVRRARFLVIERPGKLRSRRYLLDADTPAVLDPNGQTLRVEADEDDLERFDARTIPTFSDDDLIEALFAKPAA